LSEVIQAPEASVSNGMVVTSIYAAGLSLLYIFLSVRVIETRRSLGIGLADGGNKLLMRRIRVHANFAEYVPLALILMFLAETQLCPKPLLHVIGLLILSGRVVHACGVGHEPETRYCRSVGMGLTFGSLIIVSLLNLLLAAAAL
jgi:uncharacterized protein